MPNNQNAKKAQRQNEKARLRNRVVRTKLRNLIRKVHDAVTAGDASGVEAAFRLAVKRLDQAAARHYIHKNKAARLKSRLASRIAGAQAGSPA